MGQIPGEVQGVPSAGPAPRAAEGLPVRSHWLKCTGSIRRKDLRGGSNKGQPVAKWTFKSASTFSGGAAQSEERAMIHQQGQAGENW